MDLSLLPYSPERDVYRLLGIPPNADGDAVVRACRRLTRTFHPDRNASPRATEEMRVINAIRDVMTDPAARAAYDRARLRWHDMEAFEREPSPATIPALAGVITPVPPHRPSPAGRYARAAVTGLWAGLRALAPDRCRRCRLVVEAGDAFCPSCGARQPAAERGSVADQA